jgi:predicted nucleotidyltransferase
MTIILEGVVGSTAYGLATPDSDVDKIGTYVGSTTKVLGFGLAKGAQTRVTAAPDSTTHEIGKYLGLALRCNPTIVELLWLPQYTVETSVGQELVDLRYHFLSERAVKDAYIGYAIQQAKRLLRRSEEGAEGFSSDLKNRTAKHARHCYRLLTQAQQILTQESLTVRLDERTAGVVFQMGEWACKEPQKFYDAMIEKAAVLENLQSSLFEHPDAVAVEKWLVSVRLREPHGF